MKEVLVPYLDLKAFVAEKLIQANLNAEHAEIVADVLVHADLRGVSSHGVLRMEHYAKRIKEGGINPNPTFSVQETGPASAIG